VNLSKANFLQIRYKWYSGFGIFDSELGAHVIGFIYDDRGDLVPDSVILYGNFVMNHDTRAVFVVSEKVLDREIHEVHTQIQYSGCYPL
jgi:hypothetical protein